MKHWMHLLLAAAVAAVVGAGSALFTPARAERAVETGPALAELSAAFAELEAEHARLAERLAAQPAPASAAESGARRVPVQDLDAAIAAYMAKRFEADASDGTLADAAPDLESAALAERILSGALAGDELDRLWQRLRDEGRIDAVVAEIEQQAALAPSNPDLQAELGKAYLQKLFDVGIGPMAALWGEKADGAFDRALALDETHWEARFQKALSLSNWPTFLGKQPEAVRNFEILVEQQERAASQPHHAYTYTFLGNLYDQAGEREKALETWRRGAQRFPGDEELRKKTEAR